MAAKGRASRGNTHEPYECCGKDGGPYGRPKASICRECGQLIADGKAARAKAAADRAGGTMQPFRYHERDYAVPGYHGLGIPDRTLEGERADLQRELQQAQYRLVIAASVPAPATTPPYATNTGKEDWKNPWPHVLSAKEDRHEWGILLLLRPDLRAAIDHLDQAIRRVVPATYMAGKAAGRSIITGLAKGELSLTDFDEALLTADERAEKQKARRGY